MALLLRRAVAPSRIPTALGMRPAITSLATRSQSSMSNRFWKSELASWVVMEKGGQESAQPVRNAPTRDQNFDHEKWGLHKDPKRHIRHFVTWGYSAATQRILFPDLAVIMASACTVTAYNAFAELPLFMPPEPIVLPSVVLGLLVTFRTNTANARYAEARQLWGEIVNTSRDVTRIAMQWLPQSAEDKYGHQQAAKVCRMTKAFSLTLKYHLTLDGGNPDTRPHPDDPEFKAKVAASMRNELMASCFDVSDPVQADELEKCIASAHRPLWTIQQMCDASHSGIWARSGDRPDRAIRDAMILERHFQRLCGAMGACERIHRTPIPTAFTRHTSRFLTLWCNSMPFVLWPIVGGYTPVAAIFVSWALLGTEDIGVQVEEPFDVLPLFQYVQGIAGTCDGLVKDAKAGQITLSADVEYERNGKQIPSPPWATSTP